MESEYETDSDIGEIDIAKNDNYIILSSFFEDNNGINIVDRLNSLNNTHKKNNILLKEINNNISKLVNAIELQTKSNIETNELRKKEYEMQEQERQERYEYEREEYDKQLREEQEREEYEKQLREEQERQLQERQLQERQLQERQLHERQLHERQLQERQLQENNTVTVEDIPSEEYERDLKQQRRHEKRHEKKHEKRRKKKKSRSE